MKWILLILFFPVISICLAQNNKIDYLEMLYDQGHYRKVHKKSKTLLSSKNTYENTSALLFYTLSEYMTNKRKRKYSAENVFNNYRKICLLDTNSYIRNSYNNYIYDLRSGMIDKMIFLHKKGKIKQSKKHYEIFNELFNNGKLSYENIIDKKDPINISDRSLRDNVIDYAKKYIGVPYKHGGTNKKGFDCSGFTQYVLSNFGYSIPRTAKDQAKGLKDIKIKEAKKGDLIFFGKNQNNITHVGIIANEKGKDIQMIHASSSKGIMLSTVSRNSYWETKIQKVAKIID